MVSLQEHTKIEEKVVQLNQTLQDSGIPQLCFDFDSEDEVVHIMYKTDTLNEWIGSIVDSTPIEILEWLKTQETQFYLYNQLISYFGDGFAHAIILNDSTVTLTLNHLTYVFSYDREHLVVTAFKYYLGRDLAKVGSELGALRLEYVRIPPIRKDFGTKVSLKRTFHETKLAENLGWIQNTFKSFEDMVVNQTIQIKEIEG